MEAKAVSEAGAVVWTPSPIREGGVCSVSPQIRLLLRRKPETTTPLAGFFLRSDTKQRAWTALRGRMKTRCLRSAVKDEMSIMSPPR